MKEEVARTEIMAKLEERIELKLKEPTKRVEVFESRNWIQYFNMVSQIRSPPPLVA